MNLKTVSHIHRTLGLILGINLILLCLTGSLLVWKDLWEVNIDSDHTVSQESFQLVDKKLRGLNPDKKILAIFLDDNGFIQTRVTEQGTKVFKGAKRAAFDRDGELATIEKKSGFSQFLLDLHRNLLWSGWGKYLVGLIGLFISLTVLLGFKSIDKFKKIAWAKTDKLRHLSTHINIGKFTITWILLLSLSGMILSFNSTLIALFIKQLASETNQIENSRLATIGELQEGFKSNKRLENFELDFIAFPDTEFSPPNRFVTLFKRDGESLLAVSHAENGTLEKLVELPWYLRVLIASEPLHFGNFAGIAGRILWTMMSFLTLLIPISGYRIFINKKRSSKLVGRRKFHLSLPANRILLFLGAYQIMTLGSLGIIRDRTEVSLGTILLIYGLSILIYFFMTRYAHNFMTRVSYQLLYLLGGIGLLCAACFIAIAIFYSNSILYFVLSRASFALLASFILPLQNSVSFDREGVKNGQLSDSVIINLGRVIAILSLISFGLEFTFALFLNLIVNLLIFTKIIPYGFTNITKGRFRARYIPIVFTALNSMVLTYLLVQTHSLGEQGIETYLNILLFSSILVVGAKAILIRFKLQDDLRVLVLALVCLGLSLPFVGELMNVFMLVFFFSLFVALTPHHYSAFLAKKQIDKRILSSEVNSLHILGNALGAILMGISVKYQVEVQMIWAFAVVNFFALIPVIKKEVLYANS